MFIDLCQMLHCLPLPLYFTMCLHFVFTSQNYKHGILQDYFTLLISHFPNTLFKLSKCLKQKLLRFTVALAAESQDQVAWIHSKDRTDAIYTSVFPWRFPCRKSDSSFSKDVIKLPWCCWIGTYKLLALYQASASTHCSAPSAPAAGYRFCAISGIA